ncbi:MAG TPA: response regulator [bacterium]|nr:response regulator [bacterium]HPN43055.1 response regulator [bacterium]
MSDSTQNIKILLLEDNPYDIELTKRELYKANIHFSLEQVNNKEAFVNALTATKPDIILADYNLPQFNGLTALEITKALDPSIPFIIVTGAIAEETAAETIKMGAWDFVVKERLFRLGPVVINAIKQKQENEKKQQIEKALVENEILLSAFMNSVTDGFSLYDSELRILKYNQTSKWFFSPGISMIDGKSILEISPSVKTSGRYENYLKVIKTGIPYNTEAIIDHQQMGQLFLQIKAFKVGNYLGIISTDITEQKKAENALRISEEQYRTLVEGSGQPICMIDENGQILFVNQIAASYINKKQDELAGNNISNILPEQIANFYLSIIKKAIQQNQLIVNENKVPIGNDYYWLETRIFPIKKDHNSIHSALVFILDINERKKSEEERNLLYTAFNHTYEIVIITDQHFIIQYVNPAFERLTGFSRESVIGQNTDILQYPIQDKSIHDEITATIKQGNIWRGHLTAGKIDNSAFEAETTIASVLNDAGIITNYVIVIRDVTEEKKLELQLRKSQKLETIGTLAGGIAHDFNNILVPIIGYSELLTEKIDPETPEYTFLDHILKAGARAKDLINQILTFSRRVEQERRPIYVQTILKEVIKLLRASIPTSIEIRQKINTNCDTVLADPTQLHQVVMNLCVNAFYAMRKEGGTLTIELDMYELKDDTGKLNLPKGAYVKLFVSDTGEGMDQTILERIFEPFFTTKRNNEGTGLGLSVVHGIVLSHEGEIVVESQPNVGTSFTIYLPAYASPQQEKVENTELPKGHERILFVDDEEEIVELNLQILEQLGYQTTVTSSSLEALEIFQAQPDQYDLLFTDYTMPKMNGLKLAQEVSKIKPGIPIILCTGYSENVTHEQAQALGIKEFVFKPLTMSSIAQIIRRALDDR